MMIMAMKGFKNRQATGRRRHRVYKCFICREVFFEGALLSASVGSSFRTNILRLQDEDDMGQGFHFGVVSVLIQPLEGMVWLHIWCLRVAIDLHHIPASFRVLDATPRFQGAAPDARHGGKGPGGGNLGLIARVVIVIKIKNNQQ